MNIKSALLASSLLLVGCSHKPTLQGVDGMASQVPATALFFVGADARDKMPKDFVSKIDDAKQHPELAPAMANLKSQLGGIDPVKIVKGFEPAGWAILLDPGGKKNPKELAVVGALWVRDRKEAEATLAELSHNEAPQKSDLQGKSLETYKAGFSTCFAEPFLIVSNSPEGIKAVLQRSGPSLAEDASYKAAHSQMFQSQSMVFCYSPISSGLALASPDAPKKAEGVKYLAGGVGKEAPYRPQALLSLDPAAGSALVKSLLNPPASSNALAANIPSSWNFYMMLQMRYPLQAISGVSPQFQSESDKGLKRAGTSTAQIDKAFEGDLALAFDLDQYFAQMPDGVPNGMLTWGVRDAAAFEGLWKLFCSLNRVRSTTTKYGDYQVEHFPQLPFLVLAHQRKANSAALLVLGKNPDELLHTVTSLKLGQSMKESPALKSASSGALMAVQYDLRNTTQQLKKLGLLGMSPELAPIKTAIDNWSPEMWQGDLTVKVEKDGIKAEGNPVTMFIAAAFQGGFWYGFFGGQ
ncbi:hypothetical protein JST97_17645 [bacterium]|nr:hypothetical protein [bacterium]